MVNFKKHLFCFGFGYVAEALVPALSLNYKISGTHQNLNKLKENHYLFSEKNIFDLSILNDITHILISIPPKDEGDLVYNLLIQHIKNLPKLEWIGYLSSTSVYGDHQSAWVNEKSRVDYNHILGKNRLIAEEQWINSNLPINIMRLAAIYGKNRSIFDLIKANQTSIIYKKNHFFSRIYIKDLVTMLSMIINSPNIGEIYNIADDHPAPNHEVSSFAYRLLDKDIPNLIDYTEAELSERMKQYYNTSKKIDNTKFKEHYNYKLKFPSYKEGLSDLIQ